MTFGGFCKWLGGGGPLENSAGLPAGDFLKLASHLSCGRWDKQTRNTVSGRKGSPHGKDHIPCKETGSKGQSLPRGQYVMFIFPGRGEGKGLFLFHKTASATLGTLPCPLNKTPWKACPFCQGFYLMRAELGWTAVLPLQEEPVDTASWTSGLASVGAVHISARPVPNPWLTSHGAGAGPLQNYEVERHRKENLSDFGHRELTVMALNHLSSPLVLQGISASFAHAPISCSPYSDQHLCCPIVAQQARGHT